MKGASVRAAAAYRRAERFAPQHLEPEASVTHAAAYRRAQELGNEAHVFDYRRKVGVAWTGIFAPEHTPKHLLDPQTLWTEVERIECRANARMAREMIIALPHQVGIDVYIALLNAFLTRHLVARGMVADVAIHRPPVEHGGDSRNWHAHVLLTDRPMLRDGFAARKDRTWNARENVILWRKAWADTHNAAMAALGLPHRIDHRSLEAQRADAVARGDVIAALDLDRIPQIHVGKAHHARHPGHAVFQDRRARNAAILTRNTDRAAARHDRVGCLIARADTAAHLEARRNAHTRDTWQTEPLTLAELQAAYGRRGLSADWLAPDIAAQAARAAAHNAWLRRDVDKNQAAIDAFLLGEAATRKPGNPWFHVSARDLAFVFYSWGLSTLDDLRRSLKNIAEEEARRHPKAARKIKPRPLLNTRAPPTLSTPAAATLTKRQVLAPVIQGIYLKRLGQRAAFQARHQGNAQRQSNHRHQLLARAAARRGKPVVRPEG